MAAAAALARVGAAVGAWNSASLAEWIAANAIAASVLVAAIAIARLRSMRPSGDAYRRGAIVRVPHGLRSGRARRSRVGPDGSARALRLGGTRLARQDETRHFKLIGTTGAGKSTAIGALLRSALARGDRAVITDPNGAYLSAFHDRYRGDVVLNPFEPHSARWDPFAEARYPHEYDELARALIPECDDAAGREWRGYARTLVAALAQRCGEAGQRDLGTLWRLLTVGDVEHIRRHVAGTPAQPFLDADNIRMFSSIRSVATSALAALRHIEAQRGRTFSVRDWAARGRGVLFLPYQATQIAALRSIISAWMRLAIFEALSATEPASPAPESAQPRLWFVVDELDALGAIDGLKDALARLRKFGGCCVLAFQSIAQLSSTYGAGEAQTIVENCGNTLILRCAGSERGGTSAFASRLIGERELVRRQTSRSRDAGALLSRQARRRSTHVADQRVTEAAVLPSEIEQLPDLVGYLKTASAPHWTLIRLPPDVGPWRSTISA